MSYFYTTKRKPFESGLLLFLFLKAVIRRIHHANNRFRNHMYGCRMPRLWFAFTYQVTLHAASLHFLAMALAKILVLHGKCVRAAKYT